MTALLRLAPWTEYDARDLATLKARIAAGADVNTKMMHRVGTGGLSGQGDASNKVCEFPLGTAVFHGNVEACKLLLEAGADPNRGTERQPALVMAIDARYSTVRLCGETRFSSDVLLALIDLLVRYGADPNGAQLDSEFFGRAQSPIFAAVRSSDNVAAKRLLELGADVNVSLTQPNIAGTTPLHTAAHTDAPGMVELLLAFGANPVAADGKGQTPLHVGAKFGEERNCRLLVGAGGYHQLLDSDQRTALHHAVVNGLTDVASYFLQECGEDVDQIATRGQTLDELARHPPMLDFLRQYRHSLITTRAVDSALSAGDISPAARRPSPDFGTI